MLAANKHSRLCAYETNTIALNFVSMVTETRSARRKRLEQAEPQTQEKLTSPTKRRGGGTVANQHPIKRARTDQNWRTPAEITRTTKSSKGDLSAASAVDRTASCLVCTKHCDWDKIIHCQDCKVFLGCSDCIRDLLVASMRCKRTSAVFDCYRCRSVIAPVRLPAKFLADLESGEGGGVACSSSTLLSNANLFCLHSPASLCLAKNPSYCGA